jgi:hypothetical protein
MFHKGKHFLAAAALLHQIDRNRDVVLQLLCQGLEIIQKGLLLARNYDKFKPKLRKLGHDLVRISDALHAAYTLKPLKKGTKAELQVLSDYYRQHLLRYGTIHDVFGDTRNLPSKAVVRKAVALTVLGDKVFR